MKHQVAKQRVAVRPYFSGKNVNEALKEADIAPKSFFSKYAINAIAKTTPCLKKW
ncbi:MAG: hypothetical protein ACXW33_00360 [Sulfuricurvum sp.]